MDSLWGVINEKDSVNLLIVTGILTRKGWLGPDEVGERASMAIFLVIQHSDSLTQVTWLPAMRRAAQQGKARAEDLALLEDRVLTEQGKGQPYGSQVRQAPDGKAAFFPIQDEPNVNKRRVAVGLGPLEDYAHISVSTTTCHLRRIQPIPPYLRNPLHTHLRIPLHTNAPHPTSHEHPPHTKEKTATASTLHPAGAPGWVPRRSLQSLSLLPGMGSRAWMIRGPRSRAGLMA